MNPNTKKLKDNFIKVSTNHYDYQILKAHSEKSGIEMATLVRELAMSKLHDLMFHDQPIAILLPAQNKVEVPMTHFLATQKSPLYTHINSMDDSSAVKGGVNHA